MIDLLTFTQLYPNAAQPRKGVFVQERLRHLVASGRARTRVVAPVPWFPFRGSRFGEYGTFARVPETEMLHGISVSHPRYPVIPKVGMRLSPILMSAAVLRHVRGVLASGADVHAIDAHYFYPDGVAAVRIGRAIGKPVVITARGTDINLIPRDRTARRQILWAALHAAAIITVCRALAEELERLGVDPRKIRVLRNGVDLAKFRPVDVDAVRRRLGMQGPTLLSVGYLIERKGHHLAIEALTDLPDVRLAIIGEGELGSELRELAAVRGVDDRVRFVGAIPHDELRDWFGAADALVLASSREGMANVLLECLACGTPVIATNSWGSPEVVSEPRAGVLIEHRDAPSIVDGYRRLMASYPGRSSIRRYAEGFSWEATTRGQLEVFGGLEGVGGPGTARDE